ncbi:hypothetical protein [Streptomyces olivoreticuli]|uniref:hypothetical protein n=1 Tax=Streptomyces olivoreticuli TaxID=68246 RepID=UPI000E23F961|nr:hypothetical protein [Streptomyces olivoreticuli]
MSRWDADLQQWVDDDPPPRRPHHHGPHEPTEPDVLSGPRPADDGPEGPSHAAVLAGVLAGVVLAGGIGFGIWELSHGGGGGTPGGGGPSTASAPATIGPSYDPSTVSGGVIGGATGVPTYAPPSTFASAAAAPAGYLRTRDPAGFTLDVPLGWQRTTDGTSVFFRTAGDESFIQVFQLHGPEATPYDAIVATEAAMSKNADYRRLRMDRLGSGAAELEYTYTRSDGGARHVAVHDLVAPDHQQYALLVAGPSGDWPAHARVFQVLLNSFCPTGYCANGG